MKKVGLKKMATARTVKSKFMSFDYRKAKNGGTEKEILAYESNLKKKVANKMKKKREYTGHYQEDSSGKIRHQSPTQVKKKNLGTY